MAHPAGATNYIEITNDHTTLAASMPDAGGTFAADLVIDQAAAVNYEGGAEGFIDGLAAGCADLKVTSSDGAITVPFGIKQFSQAAGSQKLILGLGIPSTAPLLSSADTTYRLYRGCTGGTFENKAGVVPTADGFVRYCPLEEQNPGTAGGGAVYRDWVNDALTGLDYASTTTKTGQIGSGQGFDDNDYIALGNVGTLTAVSISVWYMASAAGTVGGNAPDTGAYLDNTRYVIYCPGPTYNEINIGSGLNVLHHLCFTWSSASGTLNTYRDGALIDSRAAAGASTALSAYRIGYNSNPAIVGWIDEYIIQAIARSANWIASYYNMTVANGTFWSVGAEQSCGGIITPRRFNAGFSRNYGRRFN